MFRPTAALLVTLLASPAIAQTTSVPVDAQAFRASIAAVKFDAPSRSTASSTLVASAPRRREMGKGQRILWTTLAGAGGFFARCHTDIEATVVIRRRCRDAREWMIVQVALPDLRAGRGVERVDVRGAIADECDVAIAGVESCDRDRRADCGIATRSVANAAALDFVPIVWERFDLAVRQRDYFRAPLQSFFGFLRSEAFAARARELGGYDTAGAGAVRHAP